MSSSFDFVVVGGGPAGCALAATLCASTSQIRVLLLEAGGENEDEKLRVDGRRWLTFQNTSMNWGYKTVPQPQCGNREIDYSRGLGMGGSSAINFGVYTIGPRDDYEEWARITADDAFGWEKMQQRFKSLESFHDRLPSGVPAKYAAPNKSDHGFSGPLRVGYAAEWERDLVPFLDSMEDAGFSLNQDHNSGNPMGMSVLINSSQGGLRSTAKDLLTPVPGNLTIMTNSPVRRVIVKGKRVIGVECNNKTYYASKEVILCAGALNTPKILMHSGIGDPEELQKFNIPIVAPLPAVGKGLRDHMFSPLVYKRTENSTDRAAFYGDKQAMADALAQWEKDKTGPWSKFACENGIGWFKLDGLDKTDEFGNLPESEKQLLQKETIPHYELFTHFPIHWFIPDFPDANLTYACLLVFPYNAQTRGQVSLQSPDPDVPLLFDPKFLDDPFDRRIAIESLRDALRLVNHDAVSRDTVAQIAGPESDSDADLLAYFRQTLSSSWHMTGTVKMGPANQPDAAVDSNFHVLGGIEGLRVADMSVVPILSSCHIQSVAYVTGITCAEKIIQEHHLSAWPLMGKA